MKKTYNQPTCLVVQLRSRDSLLVTVSATNSLSNTRYGGTTSVNSVTDADVKGTNDVNLWDNEW
jgi:hypothetical protein